MNIVEEIKNCISELDCRNCWRCGTKCRQSILSEVLDYINQLEAQAVKWKKASDEKPIPGQWVMTYCGGHANWYALNKWCGNRWLDDMPVTHWMPLSSLPEEDECE